MRLDNPPVFSLQAATRANQLELRSAEGHVAHVFVLEQDVLRLLLLPHNRLDMPRTWAVAPGLPDLPPEGRDRFELGGFALPRFELRQEPGWLHIQTDQILLRIELAGLHCHWHTRHKGKWTLAAQDRPTQAYNLGWWDQRVYH